MSDDTKAAPRPLAGMMKRALLLVYHWIAITAVIIVAANLAALVVVRKTGQVRVDENYKNYVTSVPEERFGFEHPGIYVHTVLHFTSEPFRSDHYTVGVENIRYHSRDWSDSYVREMLYKPDNIFILGGSTSFGWGVPDDNTWPYYFDRLTSRRAFNLATPGYEQHRELDKLLYLLKKGYRPKTVVFFDGVNDIGLMTHTNYNIYDQYNPFGFLLRLDDSYFGNDLPLQNEITFTKGSLRTILRNLPIYMLYRRLTRYRKSSLEAALMNVKIEKDANLDKVDLFEAKLLTVNPIGFYSRDKEHFRKKIIDYYRSNLKFLDALSRAFGFDYLVFYQPIGIIDKDNSYLEHPAFEGSAFYQYYSDMDRTIRENIAAGNLQMHDVSRILEGKKFRKYIGFMHYTRESNQVIAEEVFKVFQRRK